MATPPKTSDKMNKAVIVYLDGRRLNGYIYDFSAMKDRFRLFPEKSSPQSPGAEVLLKDLKGVFFVRDFGGNPEYQESSMVEAPRHGRRMQVTFKDGETVMGTTEAYNPQKLGFFLFPADPKSNNVRIFIVNRNVAQTKFIVETK